MRRRSATLEAESVEEYVAKSVAFNFEKTDPKSKRASSLKKNSGTESKSNLVKGQMESIKESEEQSEESPTKISKFKKMAKPVEIVNERGSIANLLAKLQLIQSEKDGYNFGSNG